MSVKSYWDSYGLSESLKIGLEFFGRIQRAVARSLRCVSCLIALKLNFCTSTSWRAFFKHCRPPWSICYLTFIALGASDSAICGRLAALILRLWPTGLRFGSCDHLKLGGRFGYFYFFCSGRGVLQEGEGPKGREGVFGELGNVCRGGGGLNIFFRGRNVLQANVGQDWACNSQIAAG